MFRATRQARKSNSKTLHNCNDYQRSAVSQRLVVVDRRPLAVAQRRLNELISLSPSAFKLQAIQRKVNNTGLPDALKAGIEHLSGIAMDDVQVHRNSSAPSAVMAHAYTQGSHVYLAPGQDRHLPHEAWHVVQQKQGRVKPTLHMQGKVPINDDPALEREADRMGAKAVGL
jgi:hypothetical protein